MYDNGITCFYNFGTTEAGFQRVPTPATIYEIGSISKTFTSLLLAHAVLEKKLKLTDDIRQYLPGHCPNLTYQGQPIRLVHLANTTAGLPDNLPDKPEIFKNKDPDSTVYLFNKLHQHYSKGAFCADLRKVTLTRVPGTQPAHSNVAAELLGHILENVYHTSYAGLVQRYITGPLRMASTTVAVPASQRPQLAVGHNKRGKAAPYLALADLQAASGYGRSWQQQTPPSGQATNSPMATRPLRPLALTGSSRKRRTANGRFYIRAARTALPATAPFVPTCTGGWCY